MKLKDKIIVVTGATGGIGRELVKKLDKNGSSLVLVSRTKSELENLTKELGGKNNSYFACDLSDQKETETVVRVIAGKFKKVDVLISAAGIGIYKPLEDANVEDWNRSINTNVLSNFILIKELQKSLEQSENPLILAIGSGAGVIPMAGRSLYCCSKFALRGLILSLSEEFSRTKLRFCLITLGSTLTSFGPMSLEEKQTEALNGKAYFTVDWVVKKLVEIIKDDKRETEYTLYPGDYGLGKWEKPDPSK